MTIVLTVLGLTFATIGIWDVFRTLWQPGGDGRLSRPVLALMWRVTGALGPRARAFSGPIGVVLVILLWLGLVIVGWALVYGPRLPDGFVYATGLQPELRSPVLDALYLSAVTVTTLGYGDIVPTASWLRLAAPLQAMAGFAILTAAVSWVLQVYPALTRRRTLANRLSSMRRASAADRLVALDPAVAAPLLLDLSAELSQLRVDLFHYPETYYFMDHEPGDTMAETLPFLGELADAARAVQQPDLQLAGDVLSHALDAFVRDLGAFVGEDGETGEILAAFRTDHTSHR